MKVSGSILFSAIAAAYLAAHLPFLAPSLEDIDSINFALGLRDYDVAQHQPHPPGYPVYIALGRLSLAVMQVVRPGLEAMRAEALALAIWSAAGAAAALIAAGALFSMLPGRTGASGGGAGDERGAGLYGPPFWAAVLLACAPLFWMSGLRPLSDMPGLAAALAAQAL